MSNLNSTAKIPLSRHAVLCAFTFFCVMLTGTWQVIDAAWQTDELVLPNTWIDFREGRLTGGLEKQLDHKLPARAALIGFANSVRYVLTGGGGEQVRIGKDGWLFLTDELRFEAGGTVHMQARFKLFGDAARALERQGVKLVVALVPDKARLHSQHLANGRYPDYNRMRYQDALAGLRSNGAMTVDLLKPLTLAALQGDVYYRSDTHWNQTGAQVAAKEVSLAISKLGLEFEKTAFSTTSSSAETERTGDLIHLMGLDGAPKALRPRPDMETPVVTRQSSVDSSAGLFGEIVVPIVLTGTSYSLRGNFHGFLQQALSVKVLNTAKDGGGLLQAGTSYLTDNAFQSSKPKVLVWEVPERFLYAKLSDETLWLEKVGLKP
jgi:alginate O-acetyltransferase complex protein AlgJ